MKKYLLSAILISNSVLLMSQNNVQTNILINSNLINQSNNRNWLLNENKTNKAQPNTRINNERNTQLLRQTNNQSNIQRGTIQQTNGNPTPVVNRNSYSNNRNTPPSQRLINPTNEINVSDNNSDNNFDIQIQMNENNPILRNGIMNINLEPVQAKQIQFLADNNKSNLILTKPELNFSLEFEQQIKIKTNKVKKDKTETDATVGPEIASEKIKNSTLSAHQKETKSIPSGKHKGGSSYSQKNKSYFGKKIKIWCKKNLKFSKKIRLRVSCPKF